MSSFNVSAHTDDDGIVHVKIVDGTSVYEFEGRPEISFEQMHWDVGDRLMPSHAGPGRSRFRLELPVAQSRVAARAEGGEAAESTDHHVSTACQAEAHADCRTDCRCWCHSTCAHVIPYLVSDNCQLCGATPEEMVPDPVGLRRETAEARRQAAIKARLREGGEQR